MISRVDSVGANTVFAQTESGPDQISRRSAGMLYARCRYLSVRGIGQSVGFAPGTGFAL